MAWKLALPWKMVVLNMIGMAAFLFLIVELGRTESGRDVLGFFLIPTAAILVIDVVFMIFRTIWTSVGNRLHRVNGRQEL